MNFLMLDKMWERIEITRQDSDTALFYDLLFAGEMLSKIVASGLVAAVADDRDRHRYRQLHRVVRADGFGEWIQVIEEILLGPTSQFLVPPAKDEQRELIQKVSFGTWQYEASSLVHSALKLIEPNCEALSVKSDGRRWFLDFVAIRNATRGHGAPKGSLCSEVCLDLERSIRVFSDNFTLLRRPWVYLHRNTSGKYRVTPLAGDTNCFNYLKSTASCNYKDGIYIQLDEHRLVELVETNADSTDFLFPNGNFSGKKFQLLSYISGNKSEGDATPFLAPSGPLPSSGTQGIGALDYQGKSFGNLPPSPSGYVRRAKLEQTLLTALTDDHHPIITLHGGGGIGKTSTALTVLHTLSELERFIALIWFSARDIDLLAEGPKLVKPHVLTEKDIASEFSRLMGPPGYCEKGFDHVGYMASCMTRSPEPMPLLFVFDNFETIRSPIDVFNWIDANIRNPNKVLITTRHREFMADYQIEVAGMTEQEAEILIDATGTRLGISIILTDAYKRELYQESDGHPYIMKVLLGEVAKAGHIVRVERIVASKEEMLNALFERTYSGLSPAAKRVFLTLCSWRSNIPRIALEAVLLRPENERIDVGHAIDELSNSSFIEISQSPEDNMSFIAVPLAASIFGRPKIDVSPWKPSIEADSILLQALGASQIVDMKHGVKPRINRLFRYIANRIGERPDELNKHLPILEFIARKYPPAWILIASLYEEAGTTNSIEKAKDALRHFIESSPDDPGQIEAWERLARICYQTDDWLGDMHALAELSKSPNITLFQISNAAQNVNSLVGRGLVVLDSYEKRYYLLQLIQSMESRITEADATDFSRLAWLYLRLGDEPKAKRYIEKGLAIDSGNEHCVRLAEKLKII